MSGGDPRERFVYNLPASVYYEFCCIMDRLLDQDWIRFGVYSEKSSCTAAPTDASPIPRESVFTPRPKEPRSPPTQTTRKLNTNKESLLPKPAPPPPSLHTEDPRQCQSLPNMPCNSTVMCWPYEEVCAGTEGFSPSLQVGEGGFGVVYQAWLRKTKCAVKKLKQDCLLDRTLLTESFRTEVEKLSKFRHPNIVDLLGYSEGGGSLCLIYTYMDNRSLEDQLHNNEMVLSWSQRIRILEGASAALQFLHSPPEGQTAVIHGDVKSSNILLDYHLVAKLSDFGLARFVSRGLSGSSATQTASVAKTTTVRGTLAYLPDEYVTKGELAPALDVYSFGVVLLEVLTGRRALEKDEKSRDKYLKDLMYEVEESPSGSPDTAWRKQLDERLIVGGAAEPTDCLQVVDLACECLAKNRKKRPAMTKVFEIIQNIAAKSSSSSFLQHASHFQPLYHSFPRPPRSLDSSVGALSHQLSGVGPREDAHQPSKWPQFSSSPYSVASPHPLHSSSSLPSSSSVPPLSSHSLIGPCETDESRGFSQYDLHTHLRSNGTSCRPLSASTKDLHQSPVVVTESKPSQPSVPTEDHYNFPPKPSSTSDECDPRALVGVFSRLNLSKQTVVGTTTGAAAGLDRFSPARSLQSTSSGLSVDINPCKQRLLEKKTQYEEGRINTSELLSSDLYGGRSSEDNRGPEESDELDYLPSKHH
ncbi:interleukin-1 receptor-associated kinase 1 isoform 2-T2 [Pholidichthys leucotaenia]